MDSPSGGRLDAGTPSPLAHPPHDATEGGSSGTGDDPGADVSDPSDPLKHTADDTASGLTPHQSLREPAYGVTEAM